MAIIQLSVHQFRNLTRETIEPGDGINIFYGHNGSGKTSILEAIHFLSLGRSFRTHLTQRIIQHDADQFVLFARLAQGQHTQSVGMERSRQGEKKIHCNGEVVTSLTALAQRLPLQLLTTESHRYFHDGPQHRRQFLDWGVFHVEHGFYSTWLQCQKALKQRNAGLKNQLPIREIDIWTLEISAAAALLDQYRQHYLACLQPIVTELLATLLPEAADLQLRYWRGWAADQSLTAVFKAHLLRDQQLGYTQYGPHRADLPLYAGKTPACDYLSQGQQKLAAYALHLAQGLLLQRLTQQSPIYLIDDLASELDPDKRRFVMQILAQLQAQVFITSITPNDLTDLIAAHSSRLFHVEHGRIG
jgi:DNA replication and repair protein RecF